MTTLHYDIRAIRRIQKIALSSFKPITLIVPEKPAEASKSTAGIFQECYTRFALKIQGKNRGIKEKRPVAMKYLWMFCSGLDNLSRLLPSKLY